MGSFDLEETNVGPTETIYRKAYGKSQVHTYALTKHDILVYEMSGYIAQQFIMPYIEDLLAAASAARPRGMIADPRQMKVLHSDFQTAIRETFWPAIASLGVRRNPGVVPSRAVTRTSAKRMVDMAGDIITAADGSTVEVAILPTLEDCIQWILAGAPRSAR